MRSAGGIVHWDEVEPVARKVGHLAATWRYLGRAAGSDRVGVNRVEIAPGKWSTPAHIEGAEEEITYVLAGAGLSWQDGEVYEVAEGDCVVHPPGGAAHTLRAGPDGLDVLLYGTRVRVEVAYLPRAGVGWLAPTWVEAGRGAAPWDREAAVGEPDVPEPSPRPKNIVNVRDAPARFAGVVRALGDGAGSAETGLNHVVLPPGGSGAPPHCHSAEEEVFIVLSGGGALELTPTPPPGEAAAVAEQHDLRPGHVVARPAATRVSHSFRAGDEGMTFLAYGTRDPNDMAYYPRSDKISFRGLGLIARLERLAYMDRESE